MPSEGLVRPQARQCKTRTQPVSAPLLGEGKGDPVYTPTEWLPKVIDVGLNNRGLLYAREWLELPTLHEWLTGDPDQEQRLNFCLNLLQGVDQLHARIKVTHGDIHPGNILVRPPGQGQGFARAVFIDTPDFKNGTDDMATTAYSASNRDRLSMEESDRYSVVAVIVEILGSTRENPPVGPFPIPKVYAEIATCLGMQLPPSLRWNHSSRLSRIRFSRGSRSG